MGVVRGNAGKKTLNLVMGALIVYQLVTLSFIILWDPILRDYKHISYWKIMSLVYTPRYHIMIILGGYNCDRVLLFNFNFIYTSRR